MESVKSYYGVSHNVKLRGDKIMARGRKPTAKKTTARGKAKQTKEYHPHKERA